MGQPKAKARAGKRARTAALAVSLFVLALVFFGDRLSLGSLVGLKRVVPKYGPVRSSDGLFHLQTSFWSITGEQWGGEIHWQHAVVSTETEEILWRHQGEADPHAFWTFAYERAFLSDDGSLIVTVDRPTWSPNEGGSFGVRVYTADETALIPFSQVCRLPRRLYPAEVRPWTYNRWFGRFSRTARKWWTDVEFDGRVLSVETTGISSCQIDVPRVMAGVSQGRTVEEILPQVTQWRLNVSTIIRWAIYASVGLPAAFVVFCSTARGARRLLLWRRNRRIQLGRCPRCGYSLHGLPEPRCPECGGAFDPVLLGSPKPEESALRPIWWAPVVAAIAGVFLQMAAREIREFVFRSVPAIAGHVVVNGVLSASYHPWWWSDTMVALPPIIGAVCLYRFFDPVLTIGMGLPLSLVRLVRWRVIVAIGVGLGLNIGMRALRELLFRSVQYLGGVVRVKDATGTVVNTFHVPWWWSDWMMAVLGIVLAAYLYRFLCLRGLR